MRLLRALAGLVLLLLGYVGLFSLRASAVDYPVLAPAGPSGAWVRGAYHVHTLRSDGRGTLQEVVAASKRAGLGFVVVTDHNDFAPAAPAYVDGVLVVPGVELSTPSGHLVALGAPHPLDASAREGGIDAVRAAGALAFLAHPVQRKNPWRDWEGAPRATGLELYSADSLFREALAEPFARLLPAAGAFLANPEHGLLLLAHEDSPALPRLLGLAARGPQVALCAHDAHGLPPYADVFRTFALYVPAPGGQLPADPALAASQVVQALGSGRALCAFRALGEPPDFALEGLAASGPGARRAHAGDVLRVRLPPLPPEQVRVRVWGQGRLLADGRSVQLSGPGAVQVEVWVLGPGRLWGREWRPWLVPSPVQVLPRAAGI
ncbi:PHP domain-containing protein [Aggregicoccus sp. 17bor-14]|nr:PHP domain-containing protein [Simulacricoccus sp. 17bor-14]MRI92039.1 PHP domain-containing protein [Aggregicoccus sp. 17bor-14]